MRKQEPSPVSEKLQNQDNPASYWGPTYSTYVGAHSPTHSAKAPIVFYSPDPLCMLVSSDEGLSCLWSPGKLLFSLQNPTQAVPSQQQISRLDSSGLDGEAPSVPTLLQEGDLMTCVKQLHSSVGYEHTHNHKHLHTGTHTHAPMHAHAHGHAHPRTHRRVYVHTHTPAYSFLLCGKRFAWCSQKAGL